MAKRLENKNEKALTCGDVRTLCFLATIWEGVAFLEWDDSLVDFLVDGGGGGSNDSEEGNESFFSEFDQREFEDSTTMGQGRFI